MEMIDGGRLALLALHAYGLGLCTTSGGDVGSVWFLQLSTVDSFCYALYLFYEDGSLLYEFLNIKGLSKLKIKTTKKAAKEIWVLNHL